MHLNKKEKTAVFIDGSNLYTTTRVLGFDIDYQKLLKFFQKESNFIRAYYYTALLDGQDYSPLRPLVDWLDYNGYHMTTKQAKEYIDGGGRSRIKGSIDVELAIDMLELADHVDHIVLFSGDGDFRSLVRAVQRKAVKVTAVSTVRSQPSMASDDLRRQADYFVDLLSIKHIIARKALSSPSKTETTKTKDIDEELEDAILENQNSGIDWDNEFE
ncbi:MAG: NYN domain-containing protein [Alphaproteobacteria bacterium]